MRRQKDEELEQYIKQTQRAKRFEAKANLVTGDQSAAKVAAAAPQQDRRQQRFQQMPSSQQQMMMHGSGPKRRVRQQ